MWFRNELSSLAEVSLYRSWDAPYRRHKSILPDNRQRENSQCYLVSCQWLCHFTHNNPYKGGVTFHALRNILFEASARFGPGVHCCLRISGTSRRDFWTPSRGGVWGWQVGRPPQTPLLRGPRVSGLSSSLWVYQAIQGVPGGMDKTSGECSLC